VQGVDVLVFELHYATPHGSYYRIVCACGSRPGNASLAASVAAHSVPGDSVNFFARNQYASGDADRHEFLALD
jgi:hypothetical protein